MSATAWSASPFAPLMEDALEDLMDTHGRDDEVIDGFEHGREEVCVDLSHYSIEATMTMPLLGMNTNFPLRIVTLTLENRFSKSFEYPSPYLTC